MPSLEDVTPKQSISGTVDRRDELGKMDSDSIESPSVESGQVRHMNKSKRLVTQSTRKWLRHTQASNKKQDLQQARENQGKRKMPEDMDLDEHDKRIRIARVFKEMFQDVVPTADLADQGRRLQ